MATSFLDLTNRLLRRLNEVTIDQSDFASARGVQAMAKDVINSAIEDINSQEFEWPFNSVLGSQVCTAGVEEYNFPATLRTVRWRSFNITTNDVLNVTGKPLEFISRDLRNKFLKNEDDDSLTDGRGVPTWVFDKHGFGFGVSPSPDAAYTITYEYFTTPTTLDLYDDTPTIYSAYDEAIIQGALYHFYMFRDNSEQASIAERKFDNLTSRMRTQLINKDDRIYSGQVNRSSGGAPLSDYGYYGIAL